MKASQNVLNEVNQGMTLFAFINQDLDRVKHYIRIGLMSPTILHHFEIYSRFDYYRRQGRNYRDSILCAGCDHRVSDRWVSKVVKKMETKL
jgi:hypothetical protein